MSKQESLILKGVAILFMLFLHLFNHIENVNLCANALYVNVLMRGGEPLSYWLSHATTPVGIFLIISGYGLFMANERIDKHRWSRVLKLFSHWWLILSIFLLASIFIFPGRYTIDLTEIYKNYIGYNTTYNAEMWFLFPFVILSLLLPIIFRIAKKINIFLFIIICLCIRIGSSYLLMNYGEMINRFYPIHNLLDTGRLLFDFGLGIVAAKTNFFQNVKQISKKYAFSGVVVWLLITVLIIAKCIINYHFFGYEFMLITLLLLAPRLSFIDSSLVVLGKHSMNMWMIHSWFCYYLFHDELYSLKYPIIIFIVLVFVSLVSSILVEKLYKLLILASRPIISRC